MSGVAGVGGAKLHREIGPRNPKAMVVPLVDHHVGTDRHMARHACEFWSHPFVVAVRSDLILVGGVTSQAYAVTVRSKPCGVRFMAVAAGDARCEHLALLERAV